MSFPDVSEAIPEWADTITFTFAKKKVKDGVLTESDIADKSFEGILQPMRKRDLIIKPEGQRSWRWWTLFTEQKLEPDSIVVDPDGFPYRVVSTGNWDNAGYGEYDLTEAVNQ